MFLAVDASRNSILTACTPPTSLKSVPAELTTEKTLKLCLGKMAWYFLNVTLNCL